jgi:hypothetical protein
MHWRDEAINLHANGRGTSISDIAKRLDKDYSAVYQAVRKSRALLRDEIRREPRKVRKDARVGGMACYASRAPRKLIDESKIMPAAQMFARGLIDRAELMRRITPGYDEFTS